MGGVGKVKKTCSESAGRGEAEERGSEAGRGSRESGPKSRHSMWEVSKKVKKTCSDNAIRVGQHGPPGQQWPTLANKGGPNL